MSTLMYARGPRRLPLCPLHGDPRKGEVSAPIVDNTHVAGRLKHELMTQALATESPLAPRLILFHGLEARIIFKKKADCSVMVKSACLK
jgi:hypothetical protein